MNNLGDAIRIDNVTKRFSGGVRGIEVVALSEFSLNVTRGDIFGLLGPNGAGKTTLVKILLGSLRPTSGAAYLNGKEISKAEARDKVGFVPENHRFPPYLTGHQMLLVYGGMAGLDRSEIKSRSEKLLELTGMSRWHNTRIKKYSKGMMQRLGLAQALLNDPDLIFLDEPTDGVDPIGRHEIRNILLDLKKRGKTIFLNSHLLAEVESVCDKVAILNNGKLIKSGPVSGLIDTSPIYHIETENLSDDRIEKMKSVYSHALIENNVIRIAFHEAEEINGVIDTLRQMEIGIISVVPEKPNLEESFIQLLSGGGNE
jgi:ABC-2 type transport system ATP-binding protein